jgi:DNA-binding Lrp family transcriptional regulator
MDTELERLNNYLQFKKSRGITKMDFMDIVIGVGMTEEKIAERAEILKKNGHIKNYTLPKKIEGTITI